MQPKTKFLLLVALFVAPVAAATLLYFVFPETIPGNRLNYGTLVEPVRPLPALAWRDVDGAVQPDALKGKWSLLYLGGAVCDEACRERLLLTRQVRLALNEKRTRVQRVYVAGDAAAAAAAHAALHAEHPDLLFLAADAAAAREFFAPQDPHELFLVDPLGNWLMVYRGMVEHKGLHKDLKKLLRFSQVG